jgi:hypothetical protein
MTHRRSNGTFSSPSAGRPRGIRNLLQRRFIEALARDFDEHGEGIIRVVRVEEPATYLRLIASVLPRELLYENTTAMSEFTDDQVDELIVKIREHLIEQQQEVAIEIDRKMVTNGRRQHSD